MKPASSLNRTQTIKLGLAPWFYWVLLCATAAVGGVLGGVAFTEISWAALLAAAPALVGVCVSFWPDEEKAAEIETLFWILFASLAVALSGGAASPLAILFAPPVLIALTYGRQRLAIEATGFGAIGYAAAALAARYGFASEMGGLVSLSAPLAICALVLSGVLASRILLARDVSTPAEDEVDQTTRRDKHIAERRAAQAEAARDAAERDAEAVRADLEKALQSAEKSNAALAERMQFFAQTNHELRTPLNAIIGFSEVLKNGLFGPLSEKYSEYASLIHEGGRSLQVVVDDVLDLSKIEAGRYKIYPELLSLNDAAKDAARFMGDQARRQGVELRIVRSADVEAFADARAVRQIALNLISNALKFTPKGGKVRIWVKQDADGGARLGVRDTGRGVTPEDAARLSQPYEQSGDVAGQGAGLGLSVVRAFAELHGGRLKIESKMGEGSNFSVGFPPRSDKGASN
ncbi:MAG: HAMP domain-containing sensor histidine kinase [Pseudomonadota bacterium]